MWKQQTDKTCMSQVITEEWYKGEKKDGEGEEKTKLSEGKEVSERFSETAGEEAEYRCLVRESKHKKALILKKIKYFAVNLLDFV